MPEFNDRSTPMSLLLTRRSAKARHMTAPGPDAEQLRRILTAATRVPDHGKLAPWAFVVISPGHRATLADALENAYLSEKPAAARLERDAIRDFALQAPCLVVALHRPRIGSHIPLTEQAWSAGAATMTLLHAVHAEGFAACWLTGWAAYSPTVRAMFGDPGDSIVGFIFIGTPGRELEERPRPALNDVVRGWPAT